MCVTVRFNVYMSICQGGIYLFVNDEANELSISKSILSITIQSRLSTMTLIGGDKPRDAHDWLTGRMDHGI